MNKSRRDNHGVNKCKKHECDICGQEYTIHDPENPNVDKVEGKFFRFPDEWNEGEILAHKISHLKSSKSIRFVRKFVTLTKDVREEILDFIDEYYAE